MMDRVAEQVEARLGDKPICCCACHQDENTLGALSARCRALVSGLPRLDVSEDLLPRLSDSPSFQFGFNEFISTAGGTRVVARLYCAVPDPAVRASVSTTAYRFFKIDVPRIGSVAQPSEYNKGDVFFIDHYVPDAFDAQAMIKLTDRALADHLEATRARLHAFVEEAVR